MVYPNTFDKLHIGPSGVPVDVPASATAAGVAATMLR
jgi:hypothetical protein